MITLYKGDDTGGQLGKNVKIVFHCDDAVDMDDVVVKFDLLGIVKREFTDVHDGDILDIFISHAESRKFPLGVIFAKMWGEDASGKLRTFANRIPFRVTLNLIAVYGSDGTDSQDIHVYSSVDWDSIANKPTVFPSSVEEVEGLQEELDDINGKIPEDASADNQLADKEWVDQEIDRVAAYYITSDAQGNPFQTRAALLNAETYYSGGSPRTPTRNDYAIVLADETHEDTEWRYIYSVNEQGVGTWEAQYPVEGAIVADDNVTKTSTNPVKSSGIWAAIWGALAAIPSGFSSLYDWVVAQLGQKRNYTDLSYNTQVTVNAPALHAILTSRGTQLLEYYLPCTEDIPATPEINHVYTWRRDGAEFYITQGVSALSTIWTLYNSSEEQLSRITTDNATQGYFPDLTFETSAYAAVTSTKVNSYPDEVQDALALDSNVPAASTSLPRMDSPNGAVVGTPGKYACSDHVHPTDTSRMAATATGEDIPAFDGSSQSIYNAISSVGSDAAQAVEKANSAVNTANGVAGALTQHADNTNIHVTATEKATWNGKQNALTAQQLANIAAVSDALAFDATHSYATGDPVVYNGTLYTFTAAHTGAWTGSDVSAVDIIARLAGKLGNTGNQTLDGSLTLLGIALTNGTIIYNGSTFSLDPWMGGTLALMAHIAPDFSAQSSYEVGQLVVQNFILKRCTTAGTGSAAVFASATVEDVLAALRTGKANRAANPTAGNLAALDANGNPTDSQIPAANIALKGNIPYDLGTPTVIDTASSETVEGETVYYGAATLANRTANIVQVTATLDELRITFPAATSGKVRDFGLRVEIGTGSAELAAPALVPIAPTGETIKIENNAAEIPALADGTATAKGVTLLYFSETAPWVFVVKGEQVEEVA